MNSEHRLDGFLTVIHINGPLNSGKSTVGRALAHLLENTQFLDGDELAGGDSAPVMSARVIRQLEDKIIQATCKFMVVAYPLSENDFNKLSDCCISCGARLFLVTLNPSIGMVLFRRGRRLTPSEKQKTLDMYHEGYHSRPFSNLFVDSYSMTPAKCAQAIFVSLKTWQDSASGA